MSEHKDSRLDQLAVNTIRTLSMDAVQAANSGHPGAPMGLAPVAHCLWQRVLRYDPDEPAWPNRDRFVLSAGHASMLLYSLLHLTGVKQLDDDHRATDEPAVSLDQIKQFRQLDGRCPGHPEYHHTSGVETTTGPLGQGLGVSTGMALAGRWLAARYNRPGLELFDYDVYALGSDGCIMEGISAESASLAGHLKLANLCWIYDNNRITIEGSTSLALSEDVAARFAAYGWHVEQVADANDLDAMERALNRFRGENERPTLIIVDSHIAYGSPNKQDSADSHGAPLGAEEVRLTKRAYGWPEDAEFLVPEEVPEYYRRGIRARGRTRREAWSESLERYRKQHPELAEQLLCLLEGRLPDGWDGGIPEFPADSKGMASRAASGKVLNAIGERVPWLLGGSADLGTSVKTQLGFEGAGTQRAGEPGGRNLHFGVREHAMGALVNGLVHCGLRGYGASFLIFSDYMRPSIRLSALMELPSIWVFSHDSISLGEDGPTHQPIEQLASLRAIPGMLVLRPADANETAQAWHLVMEQRQRPSLLVLSRQGLPTLDRSRYAAASGLRRGAYVLAEAEGGAPRLILIGTGSELALCLEARERLAADGVPTRVVSMPSWELFGEQSLEYQHEVLPPGLTARVAVEQAAGFGWERWVGASGAVVCMQGFGASAPGGVLRRHFGFTPEAVVEAAREQLAGQR